MIWLIGYLVVVVGTLAVLSWRHRTGREEVDLYVFLSLFWPITVPFMSLTRLGGWIADLGAAYRAQRNRR